MIFAIIYLVSMIPVMLILIPGVKRDGLVPTLIAIFWVVLICLSLMYPAAGKGWF